MKNTYKNVKNNYLDNLFCKITSKKRVDDLTSWIIRNEKDKYIYYKI